MAFNKLILSAALTGAATNRSHCPSIPYTPKEEDEEDDEEDDEEENEEDDDDEEEEE